MGVIVEIFYDRLGDSRLRDNQRIKSLSQKHKFAKLLVEQGHTNLTLYYNLYDKYGDIIENKQKIWKYENGKFREI
jgi:hypothetical protein